MHLTKFGPLEFDTIAVAGGDGTLNAVVRAVLKNNIKAKIGVIPAGTSNDFARHLKIGKSFIGAAHVIANGNTIEADVGQANDMYFINVFGAGLITNIPHHVDPNLKQTLGPFAYYLKGLEKLQNYKPMPVRIITDNHVIEEDIYFFLALNSSQVAGLNNVIRGASVKDGFFDILAVKACGIGDVMALLLKFFQGEHINDERVIHLLTSHVLIEPQNHEDKFETNIDGENGPTLPVEIKMHHNAIEFFAKVDSEGEIENGF